MTNGVTHFITANGLTEFGRGNYNDVSPYSMFDGVINNEDEFPETMLLDFSNASGKRRKKIARKKSSTIRSRMEARQKGRGERKDKRVALKERKVGMKEQQTKTQQAIAENIGKTSPEESKLLESLATDTTALKTATAPTGMSKPLKIGLIVGGVVVLGVIAFVVVRKMRKSKK